MARELGVTQKTTWFPAQRIRETWLKDRDDHVNGQVRGYEANAGRREKTKQAKDTRRVGRGTVGKTAVVGVCGQTGQLRAVVVKIRKSAPLERFVRQYCTAGATSMSDTQGG